MQITDEIHGFPWRSMTSNNCNTYLINGSANILIDPGYRQFFSHVIEGLKALDLEVNDIDIVISTHGHPDHLEAVQLFKDTPALNAMYKKEWEFIQSMKQQISASSHGNIDAIIPDIFLKEGHFSIKDVNLKIFHTPGHSPGSICIHLPDEKALISGDLIFNRGIGRTDLPGGDSDKLKRSIKGLQDIEAEYLLPGHGDIISDAAGVQANFDHIEKVWFNYL